jgi:uncharacterized protein
MNILVLCDDYWHPARTPRAGLNFLESGTYHFDWIENAHDFKPERLADYPVVILTKSNNVSAADQNPWMNEDIELALQGYVEGGGGLLAIHSGLAGFGQTAHLRPLLGGVFTQHPAQCPVTLEPTAGHALTQSVTVYTVQDEHYFMEMVDPQVDVFLSTTSEHGSQPGGWTRQQGSGRVCALTPGHNPEVWLHPSFQQLLANVINWCAQTKQPATNA